jgi:hypothetical protein
MNKKYWQKLQLLYRQVQSINKVVIETMNNMEVLRDSEKDAGSPLEAPVYERARHEHDITQLTLAIEALLEASAQFDFAEARLKLVVNP